MSFVTSYQSTLNRVRNYLQRPFDELDREATFQQKARVLGIVLLIDLACAIVFTGLVSLIDASGLVDLDEHAAAQVFAGMSPWLILFLGVLLIPFIEELIFRGPLRYERNPLMGIANWFASSQADKDRQHAWWDRNYKWIFYGTAAIFALVHLTNFEYTPLLLLLSPVLVGAQFIVGLLVGWLRVRFRFLWGFLLHALHNFILLGFALSTGDLETLDSYQLIFWYV